MMWEIVSNAGLGHSWLTSNSWDSDEGEGEKEDEEVEEVSFNGFRQI